MKEEKIVRRRFKKLNFVWLFLVLAVVVGMIIISNNSSARNTDDGNPNQMIFGLDPFDQEYATGYLALGDTNLKRTCGPGVGGEKKKYCSPFGGSATDKASAVARQHWIRYDFAGIKLNDTTNLTEQYDALEYIWRLRGSNWGVNINRTGGYYGGSITGAYSAFLREWHFYKVDYDNAGNPIHHLDECLPQMPSNPNACDMYEVEFAGVMRMDDFDGWPGDYEGYAFAQGVEPWGVWVATRNNTRTGKTGIAVTQKEYTINGKKVLANYWHGKGGNGLVSSSTQTSAIWVEFKNSFDENGKIIPTQMIYDMGSPRASSNSSQLVGVAFCVTGALPESVKKQTTMYRNGTGLQSQDVNYDEYEDPDDEEWGGEEEPEKEDEGGKEDGGNSEEEEPTGICYEDPSACVEDTNWNLYKAETMIAQCHSQGYEAYSVFGITKYGALDTDMYMFNIDGYEFTGWYTSGGVKVSNGFYGDGLMQSADMNIYFGRFSYAPRQEVSDSACYSD